MFDLVKTSTQDNLTLHGLFLRGDKKNAAILHIHGFESDFFTNPFVVVEAKKLQEQAVTFLSVQNRGMSNIYTLKRTDGSWGKYGSHLEKLEDAYKDIDAWITFLLAEGYEDIILQGHSLGTVKVVRYLFEGLHKDKVKKLILLAPFDGFAELEMLMKGKWSGYLEIAQQKVIEGNGEEYIPKEWNHAIEMSYQTFLSWYNPSELCHLFDFYNKNYDFPVLNRIEIPVKVIVGTKDEFLHMSNPEDPQEAIDILKKNIKQFSAKLIDGSTHGYEGYEDILVDEVINFI